FADNAPPSITCPDNVVVGTGERATCDAPATWVAATATDTCGSIVAIKYYTAYGTPGASEVVSGDIFPLGTTTVTAKVTDTAAISSTCTFTVTVNDTTPPVAKLAGLPDVTGQCSATLPAAPTATDNCDAGDITGVPDKTGPFGQGDDTITWTYTDS